jgi:glycosyltransferase involved in cell wall biosynthesis
MNIVHIVWGLGIGGVESMLVDIANYQIESNAVSIIVINDNISPMLQSKVDSRVKICPCRRKVGSKNPFPIIRLNLFLHKIKPDMIHVHMEGIARLIRIKNGTPIIRTIHNITSVSNEYPKFDKLFAISKAVQKRTLGQGFDSKVIYNGIHFDQVATSPHAMGQTCHIVNVGRLQNDKGQKVLVEAAKILKKQGNIHFTIDFIGGGENETTLKELVNAYNLNDEIHFLGFKSREYVYENLCQYDLYVQPSIFEGFGLTLPRLSRQRSPLLPATSKALSRSLRGGQVRHLIQMRRRKRLGR